MPASSEVEYDPKDFRCSHCSYASSRSTASGSLRGPMVRGVGDGQRCVLGLPICDVRSVSAECAGRQSRMVQSQSVLCRIECANRRQAPPPTSHSSAIAIPECGPGPAHVRFRMQSGHRNWNAARRRLKDLVGLKIFLRDELCQLLRALVTALM